MERLHDLQPTTLYKYYMILAGVKSKVGGTQISILV